MRALRAALPFAALSLAAACAVNPSVPNAKLSCASDRECPSGYSCIERGPETSVCCQGGNCGPIEDDGSSGMSRMDAADGSFAGSDGRDGSVGPPDGGDSGGRDGSVGPPDGGDSGAAMEAGRDNRPDAPPAPPADAAPDRVGVDACAPNACGGCSVLANAPGAACGTCGKYVCMGQSAVRCDDPGTTNNCPTWCTSQSRPAGVAASDFQCIDFDNGLPPASVWATTTAGTGTIMRTSARADSPMFSLQSSVRASSTDTATISWNDVGSATVTSISISGRILPATPPEVVPPSSGGVDLVCIASGFNKTCIKYTLNGSDTPARPASFTGIYVEWQYTGAAAIRSDCALSVPNLNLNVWNTVDLTVSPGTGVITATINGTTATSTCKGMFSADTLAKVTVGAATRSTYYINWVGYFDNIIAVVRR